MEVKITDSSQLAEKLERLAVTNRALNETNLRLGAELAHLRRQFNALADRYASNLLVLSLHDQPAEEARACGD